MQTPLLTDRYEEWSAWRDVYAHAPSIGELLRKDSRVSRIHGADLRMTAAAIILARTTSERLPDKVLRRLAGRPLIDHVVDRARTIPSVSQVVIATSDDASDDRLADHCRDRGVAVFRGSLNDVARRVRDCADAFACDYFARINADSPFLDAELIERGIDRALREGLDFVTNLRPRTWPYGIAVEVFSTRAFRRAYERMSQPEEFEHVSTYFYRHLEEYRFTNLVCTAGNHADVRLTIDDEADLIRAEELIRRLGPDYEWAPLSRVVEASRALGAHAQVALSVAGV